MVEEPVRGAVDAAPNQSESAEAGQPQGGARAALHEAIRNVMDEIEHHERQARHHLEQAAALRKALRESISFLNEQGEKRPPLKIAVGGRAAKAVALPPGASDKQDAASGRHPRSKKK
jgi:hypothetical protein